MIGRNETSITGGLKKDSKAFWKKLIKIHYSVIDPTKLCWRGEMRIGHNPQVESEKRDAWLYQKNTLRIGPDDGDGL